MVSFSNMQDAQKVLYLKTQKNRKFKYFESFFFLFSTRPPRTTTSYSYRSPSISTLPKPVYFTFTSITPFVNNKLSFYI